MIHLRIVAPPELAERSVAVLLRSSAVINVSRVPGVVLDPPGDLVLADVAREEASVLLEALRRLGIEEEGSITTTEIDSVISTRAEAAERAAAGSPADAVVWEQVESRTSESAELSGSFLAFMILATLIAAVGIVTDSIILIIGAMVVGPEFGPLAGLCVALVQRRSALARRSFAALAVGFPVAIGVTYLAVLLGRVTELLPDSVGTHSETFFIADPNRFSVIVALLAGVAGMISLTTAKSGALIGVLISVTTIPAAGNIGLAAAYEQWSECRGALLQLVINLVCIVAAGITTLALQRFLYARRSRRHVA